MDSAARRMEDHVEGANIGKEDCTEPFKGRTFSFWKHVLQVLLDIIMHIIPDRNLFQLLQEMKYMAHKTGSVGMCMIVKMAGFVSNSWVFPSIGNTHWKRQWLSFIPQFLQSWKG